MFKPRRLILFIPLLMLLLAPLLLLPFEVAEAQNLGTNWVGTFYNNPNLTDPAVATNISYPNGLNSNWGEGSPTTGVNPDNFSATFTSTQNLTASGVYTFTIRVNDGVRFYINHPLVVDQFGDYADETANTGVRTVTYQQNLTAGAVIFRIDFVEFTGQAILQFQWRNPDQTTTQPTSTPVPAATGAVVSVRGLALRTGPYLGASLIGVAVPGTSYAIQAQNRDEGLFIWYRITVGDRTGWVSGRYFQVTGNIAAVPTVGTDFENIDNAPDIGVRGVTRAIMNLRRRPSERAALISKIPWGGEVTVIGRTIQGGKSFWLHVRYEDKVGWIYAPFVGLSGYVDALPVR